MKNIHYSFTLLILYFVILYITASSVSADGTIYHLRAGQAVDLKWDSLNVLDCRASNDYYTNLWGSNTNGVPYSSWAVAPSLFGVKKFLVGALTNPGVYLFRFNCQDDDTPARYYEDEYIRVYPLVPTAPNSLCNAAGTARTLQWTPANGATHYYVRVVIPVGQSCSAGWSTIDATHCGFTTGSGVTFATYNTVSGTNYNWEVSSITGSLVSGNIVKGVYVSEAYANGGNFSCIASVAPSVQLNFQ